MSWKTDRSSMNQKSRESQIGFNQRIDLIRKEESRTDSTTRFGGRRKKVKRGERREKVKKEDLVIDLEAS